MDSPKVILASLGSLEFMDFLDIIWLFWVPLTLYMNFLIKKDVVNF